MPPSDTPSCNIGSGLSVSVIPPISATTTMKAARFYGQKDIRVEDIPEPSPGPKDIKIKVAWNGICGTDLHEYIAGANVTPLEGQPHPISGAVPPVTIGHEMSGIIHEIGKDVNDARLNFNFEVGQQVVVDPVICCETCHNCKTLKSANLCQNLGLIGLTGWGGGLSEYISVPRENVHVVPNVVPLDVAACAEPLTVAWHAINCSGFQPGQTCFVAGAGPIGLFTIKVLKARGAGMVIVSEPAQARRERSVKHGADHAINPKETEADVEVMRLTGEKGVDVSFDCAGVSATVNSCIKSTRTAGTICVVSLWEQSASVEMNLVVMGEKRLVGSCCSKRCFPEVIEAMSNGRIQQVSDLITRKVSIQNVVSDGFDALVNDRDNHIKILVTPDVIH